MKTTSRIDLSRETSSVRRWLKPEEYLTLAISNRRMLRCDDPDEGIRGLLDLATGERFFVREELALLADLEHGPARDAIST